MGEINTVKCGNDEDVIIEYHPENKAYGGDIDITVDMLKTSLVGIKWRCGDSRINDDGDDMIYMHIWELAYRDGDFGALIKHTRTCAILPSIHVGDIVMDMREYIWYEF